MRNPTALDYFLLILLSLFWASAYFNIIIATYSYGPITIAFLRTFLGTLPIVLLCYIKKIKIEAFNGDWYWFAALGAINLSIPYFLIAYGMQAVQSNTAAVLMASTPLSATLLAHFFTSNEKINLIKAIGVLIGFIGIVFLFSDNIQLHNNNSLSAFLILCGSTFYVIGGLITLKIGDKKNENVTASILIWGSILLLPFSLTLEQPWNLHPRLDSTLSLIYLGIFSTGITVLLRFYILKQNGLVFQSQVAYLIPIFGVVMGFLILNEAITTKAIVSLIAVIIGIYIVKKGNEIRAG